MSFWWAEICHWGVLPIQPIYTEWNIPTLSIGPVHFRFKGMLVVFFIPPPPKKKKKKKINRTFCKLTVETLIRRRVLRRPVWVCTVCLCPTKRTLGLYGLSLASLKTLQNQIILKRTRRLITFCTFIIRMKLKLYTLIEIGNGFVQLIRVGNSI